MNEVKVGAPEVISGSQNSNVELTVLSMMRCRELSLAEGATSEGSIVTTARLLGQLRKELSEKGGGCLRVGFKDSQAALAYCKVAGSASEEDGSMWKGGSMVTVEGLRLFIVREKVKDAYLLSNPTDVDAEDEVVNDWAMAMYGKEPSTLADDADIPVKDELVWWSCSDGKEGAWADVLPDGTVKSSYFLGSVRGALKANPLMAHADTWLALGLGNCTSDEWTEGKKLLAAKSGLKLALDDADKAEVIAKAIAECPQTTVVIAERPMLADVIVEWPQVVNSLMETGKRNYYTFNGSSWFDTGRVTKQGYDYHCYGKLSASASRYWQGIFGDSWANGIGCLANSQTDFWTRIAGSEKHVNGADLKQWHWLKASSVRTAVDDRVTAYGVTISTSSNMSFGAVPQLSTSQGYVGEIAEFKVFDTEGNLVEHYVPFVRNGVNGIIDLQDISRFITNKGSAIILTIDNPK